jgi:hypothetical protein
MITTRSWVLSFSMIVYRPWALSGGDLLFIEYDVNPDGQIELVALINAVEEDDHDPDGEAWLAWRRTHEDEGMGCAPVPHAELRAMESTEDPAELRAIVERVILADRVSKEEVVS